MDSCNIWYYKKIRELSDDNDRDANIIKGEIEKIISTNDVSGMQRLERSLLDDVYKKLEIINKNEKITKSIDISNFLGEIKSLLGREELFVYWNYILINQDSSYKREFEGFFTIPKNCSKS